MKELFSFGDRVKELPNVLTVVLFGSAARGEATIDSDVDIAVVYVKKNDALMKRVEEFAPPRVHIVHVTFRELGKNVALAGALGGEGLLLSGKPVILQAQKLKLKPMMIITYDTRELDVNARNKLNHALYGRTSVTKRGKKRCVRRYEGLTARPGITKIGKAVLLVSREKAPTITKTLEAHGAKWKEIPVWTY